MSITKSAYIHNVSYITMTNSFVVELCDDPLDPPNLKLSADAGTIGGTMLPALKPGDYVYITYDQTTHHLQKISTVAQAAPATQPTANAKAAQFGGGSANPNQKHTAHVWFYGFQQVSGPHPQNAIYILHVTMQPFGMGMGNQQLKVYDVYITKSTVFHHGLLNLNKGEELYVEFYSNGVAGYVVPTKGYVAGDLDGDELELVMEEEELNTPQVPEEEWVNLCVQGMMFTCMGKCRDARKACDFHVPSVGRYEECSHYRETMARACDSLDAQAHCKKYGKTNTEVSTRKGPKESYDELLLKRFGRKL